MCQHRGWDLLGVTTAAFFVTMFARLTLSPLVPDIIESFAVSKSVVGVALSGMWAAYALFQFPGGVITDHIGERRVILLAIGATGLTSLVLAGVPTFPLFAISAVALGAAAGLYFTAGTGFLTDQFDNTGRALGIHEIGASAAGLIAPVASTYAATSFGWRAGPLVPVVVASTVFVVFAWRAPRTPPSNPTQSPTRMLDRRELVGLMSRPSILFTTVLAMLGFFTWQAFASFFPTFLVEYVGLTAASASIVFGAVFTVTIGGAPALGWASEAIGRDAVLATSLLAGTAGYLFFLFWGGNVAIAVGTILVGIGLSWTGVVNSRFMDHLAADERGTGFGLVRTVVLLGSSLGSGVTGALADLAGWVTAYGFIVGLLVLTVVLVAFNWASGINA
jgi:predicted MFS family arabinose efflux permease